MLNLLCKLIFQNSKCSNLRKISNFKKFISMPKGGINLIMNIINFTMLSIWQNSNDKYRHKTCEGKFWKEVTWYHKKTSNFLWNFKAKLNRYRRAEPNSSQSLQMSQKVTNMLFVFALRKCIIHNDNKHHKGRPLTLCNITLKHVESQIYKAEEKLIEYFIYKYK